MMKYPVTELLTHEVSRRPVTREIKRRAAHSELLVKARGSNKSHTPAFHKMASQAIM